MPKPPRPRTRPQPGRSPETGGGPPPAPGRAQMLAAQAGAVAYEDGRSVFDDEVLVYLLRSRRYCAGFDIVNHVGERRGSSELWSRRDLYRNIGRTELRAEDGSGLLSVEPGRGPHGDPFLVAGAASGRVRAVTGLFTASTEILINNERSGELQGLGPGGTVPARVRILDHAGAVAATITSFPRSKIGSRAADYVLSVRPELGRPLRSIVAALPLVVACHSQL